MAFLRGQTCLQRAVIGESIRSTIFAGLWGDHFTPEMEEAWLEAYAFIRFEMERGFRRAAPVK